MARPASRSSRRASRVELGLLGRLVAGRAQALLERERGGDSGAGAGSGGARRRARRPAARARRGGGARGARGPRGAGRGGARGVEDDAAAERVGRRDRAHDDAVAVARRAAARSRRAATARRRGRSAARAPRGCRGGRGRAARGGRVADVEAQSSTSAGSSRCPARERVAAADGAALDAGEVDGDALAGVRARHRLVVDLHRAHARRRARGQQREARRRAPIEPDHSVPVTTVPAPRIVNERSTCSRGAPAPRRGPAARAAARSSAARSSSSPAPGARRAGDDSAPGSSSRASLGRARGIGEVGLRDRHDAGADAERAQHRGVLARLGHHAVVGGDDHQVQVDAGRARDHRAHEALVPGHVDDRQPPARRQRQRRVAELDRDAARALLRQPVGVDAGERARPARSCRGRCARRCRASAAPRSSARGARPARRGRRPRRR